MRIRTIHDPRRGEGARARWVWGMVGLLLLGAAGCADEIRSHFTGGTVVFNDQLRADKGAIAGQPTPRFFSDGGSAGDEIISEVYHSLIAVEDLCKFRPGECLWVQQDGSRSCHMKPCWTRILPPALPGHQQRRYRPGAAYRHCGRPRGSCLHHRGV
jgi:hypothetical protein